jgi:membrane protease YdiL (CAAX protease family)
VNAREIFFAEGRRLRAPWRLALFLLVLLACAPLGRVAYAVIEPLTNAARLPAEAAFWWSALCVLALAHLVALKWIDRAPWSAVWLGRDAARPALFAWGTLLGMLAIGLPSALLLASGWLTVVTGAPGSSLRAAAVVAAILVPAAMAEELLFRGYALRVLRDGMGWPAAIVLTSVTFALLHVNNPGAGPRPIALVTLAGIMLGAVVAAWGSLWAAWAAHFAWNFVLAALLHSAVSGGALPTPDYVVADSGPDWATGGSWGPEGGVLAGLGMLGGLSFLYLRGLRGAIGRPARDDITIDTRPTGREEPLA